MAWSQFEFGRQESEPVKKSKKSKSLFEGSSTLAARSMQG